MQVIKDLVTLVNRNKIKNLEVLGYDRDAGLASRLQQFYDLIADGVVEGDEDAAQMLFGKSSRSVAYRKLKSKLKVRLLNTVFFIDQKKSKYNEREMAHAACWKEWAAVKILLSRGLTDVAIDISKKVLRQARHFEFLELTLHVCKVLRMHYATRDANAQQYEHYNALYKETTKAWALENQAEEYYSILANTFIQSKENRPEITDQAEQFCRELERATENCETVRFVRFYGFLRLVVVMNRHQYEDALAICEAALQILESKPFLSRSAMSSFIYQKLVCYTQLKMYELGRQEAERGLKLERPGSFNWFKNRELSLILALHARRYQEAFELFRQATGHTRFKRQSQLQLENWKIYEAYIYYLVYLGKVCTKHLDKQPSFRLGKFLNEVPIYSRDKRGMNIPILIIQVLFNIAKGRYERALDSIEAVDKYRTRYLRREDTYRSNCFISMLITIPIAGFHKVGVERKAARFRKRLDKLPLRAARQEHEIEIIPYEHLWEMALESLHLRMYAPRGNRKFQV